MNSIECMLYEFDGGINKTCTNKGHKAESTNFSVSITLKNPLKCRI